MPLPPAPTKRADRLNDKAFEAQARSAPRSSRAKSTTEAPTARIEPHAASASCPRASSAGTQYRPGHSP